MTFEERLALSRQGDKKALEELFNPVQPLLRLQAQTLLGSGLASRLDPSDVVQETVTQAYKDLAQFQGSSEAEWIAWLRCLLEGHVAKAWRHHHAGKRDLALEVTALETQPASSRGADPAKEILEMEQAMQLAAAIERLPETMRQIIVRRVFQEEPFEEIASSLGHTSGAVRVQWTRAIRRLRQMLDYQN